MISQFKQLEQIKKQRKELEYRAKMGKISPLEFERGVEESRRAQYALANPAWQELKAREGQLKGQRGKILRTLAAAASAHAKKIDATRLQEARKTIARQMAASERTGMFPQSWKNVVSVVQAAREMGDPVMLQAALEAAVERPRPDTKHTDFSRVTSDTQGYSRELDDMATSPEQRELLVMKVENEREIANLYHERNEAQRQFVLGGDNVFAAPSIFDDIAKGVSLETYWEDNRVEPSTRLNLSEEWDSTNASEPRPLYADVVGGTPADEYNASLNKPAEQAPPYSGPEPAFTGGE